MKAMTMGRHVVHAVVGGSSRLVTITVDGQLVGEVLHVGTTLVPIGGAHAMPRLGETTVEDDGVLYGDLEKQLPPAPVMPHLRQVRGTLRGRGGMAQHAAA